MKKIILLMVPMFLMAKCSIFVEPFYTVGDYLFGGIEVLMFSSLFPLFFFFVSFIPIENKGEKMRFNKTLKGMSVVSFIYFFLMANTEGNIFLDEADAKINAREMNKKLALDGKNTGCMALLYTDGLIGINELILVSEKNTDPDFDYVLYKAFLLGKDTFKDINKSNFYLERSAKNGGISANLELGKRYEENNITKALYYYDIAQAQGYPMKINKYIDLLNKDSYSAVNIKILSKNFPKRMCVISEYAFKHDDYINGKKIAKDFNCYNVYSKFYFKVNDYENNRRDKKY